MRASLLASRPRRPASQQKALTIDAIFDPATRVEFSGHPLGTSRLAERHAVSSNRATARVGRRRVGQGGRGVRSRRAAVRRGADEDGAREAAGVSADRRGRARSPAGLHAQPVVTGALLTIGDDLYFYRFGDDGAVRLTSAAGEEEEAVFSPDGRMVAFVRALQPLRRGRGDRSASAPITSDGIADAAEREARLGLLGRDLRPRHVSRRTGGVRTPHGSRFSRLDDTRVPEFTVVDHIPYHPGVETWNYPKAGDPNPTVRLGIGERRRGLRSPGSTLRSTSPIEFLIVAVVWTPDGASVVFQVQDREQTWLDLNLADPATAARAHDPARRRARHWVNKTENPVWLKDGSFLVVLASGAAGSISTTTRTTARLIRQVTDGRWEARALHGVDESNGWIYFSGTERSPIGGDVYRIKLDGTGLTRLSSKEGTHRATFNPSFASYVDWWSDATTPPQVRLHKADGTEVRVIDANPVAALAEYRLSKPEFLQVKTRDGFVMEAMMIKPPDFDPSRRYPVYQFTYGGPHSQSVENSWGGASYMYHQLLAQHGIIVWICDNRTRQRQRHRVDVAGLPESAASWSCATSRTVCRG